MVVVVGAEVVVVDVVLAASVMVGATGLVTVIAGPCDDEERGADDHDQVTSMMMSRRGRTAVIVGRPSRAAKVRP